MKNNHLIWEPAIVAVAPNGSYKTKADHPALPITLEELTETAKKCFEAGATLFHLHLRDSKGRHILDAESYIQAIRRIRQTVPNLPIQISAEAAGIYSPEEQIALIRKEKPHAVAVALREIIPNADKESAAFSFFQWMAQEQIQTQTIVYSCEDLEHYNRYVEEGSLPGKHSILIVLGSYKTKTAALPLDLIPFMNILRPDTEWMVCAFGPHEHACTQAAAALGGHIRVGFENNLYLKDGSLAPSNAALVSQTIHSLKALGRPIRML